MKLKIQQIGPIPEVSIDLTKKMTVFCGPNNTGKTYISYYVYALANVLIRTNNVITDEQITKLQNEGAVTVALNLQVLSEIKNSMLGITNNILGQIYGLPDDKVNTYFEGLKVVYDESYDEFVSRVTQCEFQIDGVVTSTIKVCAHKEAGKNEITLRSENNIVVDGERFYNAVMNTAMPYIYHYLSLTPVSTSTIFPVERLATQVFCQELMSARIAPQGATVSTTPLSAKDRNARYPLAIWNSLQDANNLSSLQNTTSPYADLATELEEQLLMGSLAVDNHGEALFRAKGAKSKPLPITMTASVVKSLSALTFYLRYNATQNDLVIIDEPELNLHPDSQIRLARVFGKMINRNLRLLISTHSDYIIRELNNLIMLSSVSSDDFETIKEKYQYDDDMMIHQEDVNAYLFKRNKRNKTEVKPIVVTREGFEVTTIDETLRTLNHSAEEIYYSLQTSEED